MEWQVDFLEAWKSPMRKHLSKFNGVAVMRKTRGIGDAASGRAVGLGSFVDCERMNRSQELATTDWLVV